MNYQKLSLYCICFMCVVSRAGQKWSFCHDMSSRAEMVISLISRLTILIKAKQFSSTLSKLLLVPASQIRRFPLSYIIAN